ncbi:MAG TPA: DUF4388 domain-containing protein [Planctomycetota bacterium]
MSNQSSTDGVATVLLVGQNAEVGFGLRTSLGKQPDLRIVEAGSLDEAIDALVSQVVDVIVACVRSIDADGLPLLQHVRERDNLASLPVLLVAEDDRVSSRIKAFKHGASDYIARPFTMAELLARVEAAVRLQVARGRQARGDGSLVGDFTATAFTDLVHLMQIGRRTGTLTLLTPRASGQVLFVRGHVYHATFGSMEGEEAFYRLVFETKGKFEFTPCEFEMATVRNTVALKTTTLLMEAARRCDAWRHDHPEGGELPDPMPSRQASNEAPMQVEPAGPGTAEAGAELLDQLALEPCASLHLVSRDRLPAFTQAPSGAGRCLVLLVADARMAVAVACSAALPPGAEFVEQALANDQKVLAMCWRAPSGARLDVLLLDQEFPGYVLSDLRRQPDAVVVAPRDGSWFTLSMLAQNELATLLEHLRPSQLLGLGDKLMEEGVRHLQERSGVEFAARCLPMPLQHWAMLRASLQEVVQLWAAPAPDSAEPLTAAPPA